MEVEKNLNSQVISLSFNHSIITRTHRWPYGLCFFSLRLGGKIVLPPLPPLRKGAGGDTARQSASKSIFRVCCCCCCYCWCAVAIVGILFLLLVCWCVGAGEKLLDNPHPSRSLECVVVVAIVVVLLLLLVCCVQWCGSGSWKRLFLMEMKAVNIKWRKAEAVKKSFEAEAIKI